MKASIKKNDTAGPLFLLKLSLHGLLLILFLGVFIFIQSCKKHDQNPPPSESYDLKLIADNFVSPITVMDAPDASKRLFVVDQVGKVWIINAGGQKMPNPFIDISSKMVSLNPGYDERGLLGLAFHPNFKNNGKFYLFYTAPPRSGGPEPGTSWDNLTRISEFQVSGNPNSADMSSERVILEADHPQSNHNGGTIAFGPDGYLYISIGDGGNKDDIGPGHVNDWYEINAGGNGQDVQQNLLGDILRINIDQ
jgi:glucose/arabinose dehydrogenase